jgi:hypothetical protein
LFPNCFIKKTRLGVIGCISSNPRQFSAGPTHQFPAPDSPAGGGPVAHGAPNQAPFEQIPVQNLNNAPLSERNNYFI